MGKNGSIQGMVPFTRVAIVAILLNAYGIATAEQAGLEFQLIHQSMTMQIGSPAVIKPGGAYPSVRVMSRHEKVCSLEGEIIRERDGEIVATITPRSVEPGGEVTLAIEGQVAEGRYRLRLRATVDGTPIIQDAYYFSVFDPKALPPGYSVATHLGKDGKLVYAPDYRGNRIPDFSSVGYGGGARELPQVPVKVTVEPAAGDDSARIQQAIDAVAAMAPDGDGFRGAVLLKKGVYEVGKTLTIKTSGVVIRGEGAGAERRKLMLDPAVVGSKEAFAKLLAKEDGTFLITGGRALSISGTGGAKAETAAIGSILDAYVPVGAMGFTLVGGNTLRAGDRIIVRRQANADWVHAIGMDRIPKKHPWNPAEYVLDFERLVTAVEGNQILIDAPLTTAIDHRWGGGEVLRCEDAGRISRVGIENLRFMQYGAVDPEVGLGYLRGSAVVLANVKDAWARDVVTEHYYDRGAFILAGGCRNVTIRDCSIMIGDDAYIEGYVPRYGYNIQSTMNLIQNCYAQSYRHAFYVDYRVKGPNVFQGCASERDVTNSEPHHRWSSGALYDNVSGYVALMNRLDMGSGHGWSAANCVAWNTRGRLICERPPTAQNWAIGHRGFKAEGPNHSWRPKGDGPYDGGGFGHWELHDDPNPIGVSATDYEVNRWPESTLDDNPNSYWLVRRKGKWIEYDLRKPQKIAALKLSFPQPKKYRDNKKRDQEPASPDRIYFFDIAVSMGGKTWRTVYSNGKGHAKGSDIFQTFSFDEVEARYVRITANGSNVGKTGNEDSSWFHLSRIQFEPEPQFEPKKPSPEIIPASLYKQQLRDRYDH